MNYSATNYITLIYAPQQGGVGRSGTVEPEEHLRALEGSGGAFARIAATTPAGAPTPTCPGWDVQALIRHLGKVHRWAATVVGTPYHQALRFGGFDARAPEAAGALVPWFHEGHAGLLRTLREAPADLDCWTFLAAPTPRAFWCRRQAHETVVHLVDLALAAGLPADAPGWELPAAFAADGIDELLRGWMRGRAPEPGGDEGPSLRVVATDQPLDWRLSFPGRRGVTVVPGPDATPAACTIRARAVDLYLLLWNRRSIQGLEVDGDPATLERWAASRQVH